VFNHLLEKNLFVHYTVVIQELWKIIIFMAQVSEEPFTLPAKDFTPFMVTEKLVSTQAAYFKAVGLKCILNIYTSRSSSQGSDAQQFLFTAPVMKHHTKEGVCEKTCTVIKIIVKFVCSVFPHLLCSSQLLLWNSNFLTFLLLPKS